LKFHFFTISVKELSKFTLLDMTKHRIALLPLLLALCFPAAMQAQTADITEGCAPLTVKFTAPSGVSSYFWDFKDGGTSILQNPVRIFTQPDTYVVEFKETSGGPVVGTVTITIFEKPNLDITANPSSGCAPLSTFLQENIAIDPGISVTDYSWTFGDGESGMGANVLHEYDEEGQFTVSLSITTNQENCDAEEIFQDFITVSEGPEAAFTTDPSPPVACTPPLEVSFTNQTPGDANTYLWIFGNGNVSDEENPPSQTYSADGDYVISLTATDAFGCSSTVTSSVKVGEPNANFLIPDTVCVGEAVQVQNLSGAGVYNWDFGPNASPTSSTATNPTVTYNEEGNYNISLSVTSGACQSDTTLTVFAQSLDPGFSLDPPFSCSAPFIVNFLANDQNAASYEWDFGDGSMSDEVNPVHEYENPDTTDFSVNSGLTFTASLTITTTAGCSASFTEEVSLSQPNALFMPDVAQGCVPLEVTFADSSSSLTNIVEWIYLYGDGTVDTFTNAGPHTHIYTDPGDYDAQLIVTNIDGCRDTSYAVRIEAGDVLTPNFNVNQIKVCIGDTVKLTDFTNSDEVDAWHFDTEGGRTFHCYGDSVLFWAFEHETGLMDVTLTVEYNGCFSSVTKNNFILVEGPLAKLDYELDCSNPFEVQFRDSSLSSTNILWDFGDGEISGQPNPVHTYDATGDYLVTLTAFNTGTSCPPSVDSVIVHIRDIEAVITLDTALCDGVTYDLDGSQSQDVDADCWKGYTWNFTFARPLTTQDSITQQLFDSPGPHTVTLETMDINGCRDTATLDVTVYQIAAAFTADKDTICFPAEVQFDASASSALLSNITSYEWDFGDGNTLEGEITPLHLYESANSDPIVVTLLVREDSKAQCSNTTTLTIDVYEPVSTIFTDPFPAQLCAGDEINFTATDFTAQGSNLTFDWDFDNNQTASGQEVSTVYDVGGTYNVTLNFEEIASGCEGTTTTTVEVQDFPIAAFNSPLDDLDAICAPVAVAEFTNTSASTAPIGQILWDFGNNQTGTGSPVSTSFDKGTYTVQMIIATTFGCADTTSKIYDVVGPEGDFFVDEDLICKGDFVTFTLQDTADVSNWEWDFGDGNVLQDVNPAVHQYTSLPPSASTTATLVLFNEDGCEVVQEVEIAFHVVLAAFNPQFNDFIACIGEEVQLVNTSTGANSFNWTLGDGDISVEQNPLTSYDEEGSYTIELISQNITNGCTDTAQQILNVVPPPQPIILLDSICEGDVATLTVTTPDNGSVYVWAPSALVVSDTANSTTTVPLTENAVFTVTEITNEGCEGVSQPTEIFVLPLPEILEPFDTVSCPDQPLELPINRPENYIFIVQPEANVVSLDGETPVVSVNEATELEIEVVDVFGIGCSSGAIAVNVETPNEEILVPNVFTPNNDGLNDFFNFIPAIQDGDLRVDRFQVFSRFGQLIYDNEDPDRGWDGKIDGKDAPPDAYIYMLEAAIEGCEPQMMEGEVLLMR
jgi:gliding motility-associated-like protein